MKKTLSIIISLIILSTVITTLPVSAVTVNHYSTASDNWFSCDGFGGYILDNDSLEIISYSGSDSNVIIPATLDGHAVKIIGALSFKNNKKIKTVKIMDGVEEIGESAFNSCENLTSVDIPDSIKNIGISAFGNCTSLKSITIPNGVKNIGIAACEGCTELTSITIPESVTEIGNAAFRDCTKIRKINLPDCPTLHIGGVVFENTAYYNNSQNWLNDVLYIGNHLIKAKETVSGKYTIKSGTITIAGRAFEKNEGITDVTIPNSVKIIERSAFSECPNIESINIPNGVTDIGKEAFYCCKKLSKITVPDSVRSIGWFAFQYTQYYNDSENWYNEFLYFGKHLVDVKKSISGVCTVKNGTISIAESAFSNCDKLTDVHLPDSIKNIGTSAFCGCTYLKDIKIPDGIKNIYKFTFEECYYLASIEIPKTVTSIEDFAFYDCKRLKDVYYKGNKTDWSKIVVGSDNEWLLKANVHYNYIEAKISPANKSLKAGKNFQIKISNAGDQKISYKSDKPKIAKVGSKGKVTALKKGKAKITVTVGNKKFVCNVTVTSNPKLNKTSLTLKKKETFTLKITGKVGKAKFVSNKKKIATVNNNGKIVAKKNGNAVITVIANGVQLKCKVKVK